MLGDVVNSHYAFVNLEGLFELLVWIVLVTPTGVSTTDEFIDCFVSIISSLPQVVETPNGDVCCEGDMIVSSDLH